MITTTVPCSPETLMDGAARTTPNLIAVLDRCAAGLYRFFVVRTGDSHEADDLMQQLWLQAVRHAAIAQRLGAGTSREDQAETWPTAETSCHSEAWLRTVARNLIREHWRRRQRRTRQVSIAACPDPVLAAELSERLTTEEIPDDVLSRRETRDQVVLAVTMLDDADQRLLLGRYVHGRSHAQLGAELGLSDRAVEGRLYRARAALREALKHLDM